MQSEILPNGGRSFFRGSDPDTGDPRLGQLDQILRTQGNIKSTAPGADVDAGVVEGGLVYQRDETTASAERTDATNHIAGCPFGFSWVG